MKMISCDAKILDQTVNLRSLHLDSYFKSAMPEILYGRVRLNNVRNVYIPLHLHPYWRDTYNLRPEDFPCGSYAYEGIVSLPIYTKMTQADQPRVIEAVKKTLTPSSLQSYVSA